MVYLGMLEHILRDGCDGCPSKTKKASSWKENRVQKKNPETNARKQRERFHVRKTGDRTRPETKKEGKSFLQEKAACPVRGKRLFWTFAADVAGK